MRDLLWLIPALPLAGALANGVALRNRIGKKAVSWIACGVVGLSCLVAIAAIAAYLGSAEYQAHEPWEQEVYRWVLGGPLHVEGREGEPAGVASLDVAMGFQLDPLAAVMAFVVTFVGFLIHVYSVGYMGHEEGFQRYFTYLNLFMGAMLLLVLGSNYLVMFVGWEGVGLCSYLLIGFYFKEEFPPYAGRKAFIVNRIGDFAFLVGLFALVSRFGTLDFTELFGRIRANPELVTGDYQLGLTFAGFVGLCLFIGAMGKSAQFPLYVWLPDAMAGPTPVSALIHAATMVTAGVYMVARSNVIYQLTPGVSLLVAGIGCFTAIFAATIAVAQDDIKKVLAYSTVSQLGYMFLAAGVGAYSAAIFHLYTHAFFKALLFLGSGSVIHALGGEQDMRKMGGLAKHLPQTYRTFWLAALSIAGFPLLFAGFYSKDEILHAAAAGGHRVLWVVALLTAGLTAFYMFRAVHLTFGGQFRGTEEQRHHLHESPPVMTVPLWVLAAGSVAAGWVGIPAAIAFWRGTDKPSLFHGFLEPLVAPIEEAGLGDHALSPRTEWLLIAAAVAVALSGLYLAWRAFGRGRGMAFDEAFAGRLPGLHRLLAHKWYVDELYDRAVVRPLAWLARLLWKVVDTLLIEGTIHLGAFLTELAGDLGRFSTTGRVRNYALYFFLGLVALFWWLIL